MERIGRHAGQRWRGWHAPLVFLFIFAEPVLAWQVDSRVVIEYGALSIDRAKSVADITQAQGEGGVQAGIGLGLFQNKMQMELVIDPVDPARRGKRLALTARIKTAPVIYVARELPEGSCAYRVVLNHELQHQRFDLEALRALPDALRRMSREVFTPEALDRLDETGLARARDRLLQRLKYAYDALGFPRHQSIDNPQSYAELGGRCNGEFAKYLGTDKPASGAAAPAKPG